MSCVIVNMCLIILGLILRAIFPKLGVPSVERSCERSRSKIDENRSTATQTNACFGRSYAGGFQTAGFRLFSGKVRIVSRTLSGLFLIGAFSKINRPAEKEEKDKSGKSPESPRENQENPGKIGKAKRTKKEGQVQIWKPPRLKPPRLAALDFCRGTAGTENRNR